MWVSTRSSITWWRMSRATSAISSAPMISWRWRRRPSAGRSSRRRISEAACGCRSCALDLGLRAFERLVHPGVDDRLAFLQAQRAQHLVEPSDPKMRIRSSSRLRKKETAPGRPDGPNGRAAGCRCGGFRGVRWPERKGRPRPSPLFVGGVFGLDLLAERLGVASGSAAMASMILNSTLPPSLMSVPRPAMLVAMVIAPSLPASATICASCSCWRAFRTLWGGPPWSAAAQHLGLVDGGGADQHRLAAFMGAADRLDDGVVFLRARCGRPGRPRRSARRAGWSGSRPRPARRST
jgi:hypothetical protein